MFPLAAFGRSATPHMRRVEDTSAGCRDRAAASLIAAAAMDTVNGKSRLEASAATWTTRADLLERLEQLHEARRTSL
ncbi:MAG: hypothetical protein H0U34_03095 [Sphingomonas sp.]|nr:hypothetical protein [Sphingomonas sp.]